MTDAERRRAAKQFSEDWKGKGYEKGQSQPFWFTLLQRVYGIAEPDKYIQFEEQVHLDHTSFVDGHIHKTHVLVEQKSLGKSLSDPIKQSDGKRLTPFQQAKRYSAELPYSERPRWIVTCNFAEFYIYDMEQPHSEPEILRLENLEKEYYRLDFLVDTSSEHIQRETQVSWEAGKLVGILYDALATQYGDIDDPIIARSLNVLCVRIVFCLYAEDAGLFPRRFLFHDYLAKYPADEIRDALIRLFDVLDTEYDKRSKYIPEPLSLFPYVNGGLFSKSELIEVPNFTDEIRSILLDKASANFDWSQISPTIFGALFESTLNPVTRRSGGMVYTSIENIHKAIDPLFLDDLRSEFASIQQIPDDRKRIRLLRDLQNKLASLTFLDPACGSGNFLTETYLSLRRLENEIITEIQMGQVVLGDDFTPIKVSISQFYGIEINDFAVTVAKTALWIAESQMITETSKIVHQDIDFLPLKTQAGIHWGNALSLDWNDVIPKSKTSYIMGNPPFVGARLMSKEQKADVKKIFGGWNSIGSLDYVSCWYKKSADFMKGTSIRSALVSTNSVTQGEPVSILWKPLFAEGVHIDFAHRTFRWDNESTEKAHVHCVIIGFSSAPNRKPKAIYVSGRKQEVENINAYLLNGPSVFVESRKTPLFDVPNLVFGSMPNDGGKLCDYSDEEYQKIIEKYPAAKPLFRRFLGATEFLHSTVRWCLWLKDVSPSIIKSVPPVYDAVTSVRQLRESSKREATRKLASTPSLFGEIRQPEKPYIIIPRHSSENRNYIPIDFVDPDIICGDSNLLLPDADLYQFGILMSNVHNAWMRVVCGRIKSDYRYSVNIVYNNFPWPTPSPQQIEKIKRTAQEILDARAKYPDDNLASLYDDSVMPFDLITAHRNNNIAVWEAYGKAWPVGSESACTIYLMKRYQELTTETKG